MADGSVLAGRAVVLAVGVAYRRLGIETLEVLTGAGVFYGAAVTEAEAMTDERVRGGRWQLRRTAAVHLARFAQHVTLWSADRRWPTGCPTT